MIRFTALGSLELSGDDGRSLLSILSQPRRLALLAYLALARPPGFHRRDTLTALFWPDADADHARDALSQALRFLRRSLGDDAVLGRGAEEVGISRERVRCDVSELEAALDAGRADDALALYRGELLAGFNVSDAPDFERWLDGERAWLRERVAGAALARAGEAAGAGNPSGAATWARHAAALRPFDETLHRQVLEYLDAAGDRAGALQEHEAFRRRLREELESEPAPETAALVEAIRKRAGGAAPREGRTVTAPSVASEGPPPAAQPMPAPPVAPRRRLSSRTALTAAAASVLVLAGAVAAGWLWLRPAWRARHTPTTPTRIVVLPFDNLGPPEHQYFADGVTDELTTRLASVQRLSVISRTSANQYRKTTKSLHQIGEELGVSYVLEGSVRWARTPDGGGQVRITPQLIRVRDDSHVWAGSYDREVREIFAIQSEIARNVVEAMSVALGTRERRLVEARPTANMKAYDYYLQASDQHLYVDSQIRRGIEQYRKAIALDSGFVRAYLGLAAWARQRFTLRFDVSGAPCAAADSALRRAEALAPDDPDVHLGRAGFHAQCALDEGRALAEADVAERLGMPPSKAAQLRAIIARRHGRFAEAAALGEQAFYSDPMNFSRAYETANSYAAAGNYELARRWYQRAIAVSPSDAYSYLYAAVMTLLITGQPDSARAALRRADPYLAADSAGARYVWIYLHAIARDYASALRRIPRGTTDDQAIIAPAALLRAQLYSAMDRPLDARRSFEEARDTLEARRRAAPADRRLYPALGLAYAGLGRRQEALAAAARGVELAPISRNLCAGAPMLYWQARTLTLLGDRQAALDKLELSQACAFSAIGAPYGTTPVQLRLEPWWDPLRSEPRFQRLLKGSS